MTKRRGPGVRIQRLDADAGGTSGAWYGSAQVVVKADDDPSTSRVFVAINELISTRLAIGLGVPVPIGDVGEYRSKHTWVSAQVDLDGTTLPPASPQEVLAHSPRELAGLFVLDVWVHNGDRHEENILFHQRVGAWGIDFEQALGAETVTEPAKLLAQKNQATTWPFCDPMSLDPAAIEDFVSGVKFCRPEMVRSAVEEAFSRGLVTRPQAEAIHEFLSYRRDKISELVKRSKNPRPVAGGESWTTTSPHDGALFSTKQTSDDTSQGTSE